MKKIILTVSFMVLQVALIWAQDKATKGFPMIGDNAPAFTAESTTGTINFPADYGNKWKILFSHPADFTPVCTSEILELANSQSDFDKLDSKIVVLSVDNVDNHVQWVKSMETLKYKNREPVKIKFPLVADKNLVISKEYGMIQPNTSSTKDVRGVFIIDPKNKIRAIFFYPMEIGRNLEEIERALLALQTSEKEHVLTPANWEPGGDVLMPFDKSNSTATKSTSADDDNYYQVAWYMQFKKSTK
jgi:peroxiredoxin (alkyl hydroperoxide reductase subunit C)